jgi:hypothetical protein
MTTCAHEGCSGLAKSLGLCRKHYRRLPHVQAKEKAYAESAEAKAKRQATYASQPETQERRRAYLRDWNATDKARAIKCEHARKPEARAKMKTIAAKPEMRAYRLGWSRTPHARAKMRERHTGVSAELADRLREAQGGRCAICPAPMVPGKGPHGESADHCHASGEPRGLLCRTCNICLGFYEKRQRPQGLEIRLYEEYLQCPPVKRLQNVNT